MEDRRRCHKTRKFGKLRGTWEEKSCCVNVDIHYLIWNEKTKKPKLFM